MKKLWDKLKSWFVSDRYEGATYSPNRSYVQAAVQSARFDASKGTRQELVRKARYFERNNAIVNRLADLFESYTVGKGLQISPSSSDPDWNARAKEWWRGWERFPDLTSRQSLGTLLSLVARTWFIDGECFVVKTRGGSGRPRLQVFEGHMVETPPQFSDREGESIVDGIAIDPSGRPIGYYFASEDAKGRERTFKLVAADNVIHVFEPGRPGQYRGLPFLYPVINELHDLDDLHILEMRAAKDASEITNVIKNKSGEVSSTDLRRSRFNTTESLSDTTTTFTRGKNDYYQDTAGGRTVVMQRGDELEQFRSSRPNVTTQEYWRYKTELICTGVGIPYVLVFPDSMQGTVYRGALDMASQFFKARFGVLESVARELYEYAMGDAKVREKNLQDIPGDWWRVRILPPRSVNVDVGRNSSAMLNELEAGATNYDLIYGPLGLDWREEFVRLREQQAFAEAIGLNLGKPPQADPAIEQQQQAEEDAMLEPKKETK